MKKQLGFFLAFGLAAQALSAQSAGDIDRLLAERVIRLDEAVYWTFVSVGLVTQMEDAVSYAVKYRVISGDAVLDAPADLAGLALIAMRAFGIKGGVFYSIFHNKRYAFRELIYRGVFERDDDPEDTFSGEKFITVLSRAQNLALGAK